MPTPATISIIISESGSTRIERPDLYEPAWIHVHAVEVSLRCDGSWPSAAMNATSAPTKATSVELVAT